MFRTGLKVPHYRSFQKQIKIDLLAVTKYSTNEVPHDEIPKPPKRGWFGKVFALTIVGSAGVIGYSWVDKDFRKALQDTIPYSQGSLNSIFKYLPVYEDFKKYPEENKLKEIKPLKEAKEAIKIPENKIVEKKVQESSKPVEVEKSAKDLAIEKKLQDKKKAEEELKRREEEDIQLNKDLEHSLARLLADCRSAVSQSIIAYKSSADAVQAHVQKLKLAMESKDNSENQWEQVVSLFETKSDKINQSVINSERAKIKLEELKFAINDAKNNKITKKNKQLLAAEEEYSKLNYSFNSSAAELAKAQSDYKVFNEYRDLVKKGREQFKKEIESIVPDTKKSSGSKLNEEELNSLIAHAHRRIEQLQKQLAEQQALEGMRMGDALDIQKKEDAILAKDLLQMEKERWNQELELIKQKWSLETQVQYEEDLRNHLSRQAAAHSNHLSDVLTVQKSELEVEFAGILKNRVEEERRSFESKVAGWVARLRGIETAIDRRAELEKESRRAQKLWVACSGLQSVLKNGRPEASDWQSRLIPIRSYVDAVRDQAGGDLFVQTVVASIPEKALDRGVWTASSLSERFEKVWRICRRVALIDERGGTLARYFLSYLQSFFVLARPVFADSEVIDDVDKLDAFQLLDNAKESVAKGDITQAARFLNQLKGEPRRLAIDWIEEAKLTLEVSQALEALLAHASASGIASIPPTPPVENN